MFHGRNNIICSTACKYRTAATLYTPKTWFHICNLNTPPTGDNKDDDDDDDDDDNNNNNNNNIGMMTMKNRIQNKHRNTCSR